MDPINKTALRAAMLIHEQVAGSKHHDLPIYLPEYAWNNIQQLRRQIDLARQLGWYGAAKQLTENMAGALDDCRHHLEGAIRVLQSRPTKRQVSSPSDIYRDMVALYDEFEDVEIDLDKHTLSVTTDRIVLGYIGLGRFEIRLDWKHLGSSCAYRVVALDPNPATKSEDITHPHVQDEQLCEGDGRAAVQVALTECRFYDFFLLISQLLHTYGRGSAYVELDNWDAMPCEDCGDSIDEDRRYHCDRCGSTLCGSCSISCHGCDNGFCSDCLSVCSYCGQNFCSSCLQICSACRKRYCEDCLEAGLCRSCHEEQHNKEKKDDLPQSDAIQPPAACSRGSRQRRPICIPA